MPEEFNTGGLVHMGARFYDPIIGRFISADTIVPGAGNPQAFNRYAYALNRPLSFVDPSGHQSEDPNKKRNGQNCILNPSSCIDLSQLLKKNEEELNTSPATTEVETGPGGTLMAKKGSGKSSLRDTVDKIASALGLCNGLLAIICSEAARKAAENLVDEVKNAAETVGPKSSAGLADAMGRWFGPKDNNLLRANPDMRPTWASDAQLKEYLKIARDVLDKYATNPSNFVRAIEIQTERVNAILKELAQREAERGGR